MVSGEHFKIVVDEVSAFDAQQDGDAAGGARFTNAGSRCSEQKVPRMKLDLAANGGNLIERPLHSRGARNRAGRPDSEENGAHSPFAQARNIDRAVGMANAKIKAIVDETLRGIDVRIDYKRSEMEIARFGRKSHFVRN
jgi:hypothetical protein